MPQKIMDKNFEQLTQIERLCKENESLAKQLRQTKTYWKHKYRK